MFCSKCGKQIPDASTFCPICGAQQNRVPKNTGAYRNPQGSVVKEKKPKKKPSRKIGIIVIAAAAACVAIGIFSMKAGRSINLNKYLDISFDGYNTVGDVVVSFDQEKFESDYGEKLQKSANKSGHVYNSDKRDGLSGNLNLNVNEYSSADAFLAECVNGSVDKAQGVSNGDSVTYTWSCNDEYASRIYGYKLKYKDITVKVSGLKEAETFDPFQGVEVSFEGLSSSGRATVNINADKNKTPDLKYELDKDSELSNGDVVTVTVKDSDYNSPIDYCLKQYGKIPSPLEKKFKVEGLNTYITNTSQISKASLKNMKKQAEDVYRATVANDWDDSEKLKSLKYIGNYLLVHKSMDASDNMNRVYLVYKAVVKRTYATEEKVYEGTNDIYWYIEFSNLLTDGKGTTTVDLSQYNTVNTYFTINADDIWMSWSYSGYQTLDELYKNVVTANLEHFKHEDNVNTKVKSSSGTKVTLEKGIVFPNSSVEELSTEEIRALSDSEVQDAINEIYARNGYIFKDEKLRTYYEQYNWYYETIKPADFSESMFNDVELKNVQALQKERDKRK